MYNSSFNSSVKESDEVQKGFEANLHKWVEFVSYMRFHADAFFDLIAKSKEGKPFRLDLDQRVILRSLSRFISVYGVLPRGFGKSMLQVMAMFHSCIFWPDKQISLVAQNKESSAQIVQEKFNELMREFPILANEIEGKPNFSRDTVEIVFRSGSRITVLPQNQSAKGKRRHSILIDESNLLSNAIFSDAIEPIANVPRRLLGSGEIDPYELNGSITFFTTAGWKNSDEYHRNLKTLEDMENLRGKMVLGASWELACAFGRGETRSQLLSKKDTIPPTYFQNNYESRWCGSSEGALVSINKVMDLRTLAVPELESDKKSEYVLSMDVARSESNSNNQSSIAVLKLKRAKDGRIVKVQLVNLINIPNGLTFSAQTVILKRLKIKYNAIAVAIDANGLGVGLLDECLKDTIDPDTGESIGCWALVNATDFDNKETQFNDAEEILYAIKSQGINHDIIVNFIDIVESGKLQLLEKRQDKYYDNNDTDYVAQNVAPFIQTDFLLEEIANLKLKQLGSGRYTVERVTKRTDKDRFSALSYGLWIIKTELDEFNPQMDDSVTDYLLIN